jgi:hypothetical protein
MGVIFLLLFIGICVVDKVMLKESKDPVYHGKWQGIRKRWSPKITFFENLFGWILALIIFIYFYL